MRTITLEEHFASPAFLAGPGKEFNDALRNRGPRGVKISDQLRDIGDQRIAEMDAAQIDMQVLSRNSPGVEQAETADAVSVASEANDFLAEAVKKIRNASPARNFPRIPFERYADDAICHCKSAEEAQALWGVLADRFAGCKLVLHPEKTKIVYCKDANRRGDFPNQAFDFLGFSFRARKTVWQGTIHAHGFMPAVSPKALKAISRTIRRWALHHHSDKSLQDLAKAYNPYIQGWINYYGHFYRTQLRPTLKRIDAYVIRWERRKFKRLRRKTKGARDWFERLRRANPTLLAAYPLL